MKKVEAIIREEKLEPVKRLLEELGYFGMTMTEVSGRGRQKGVPLKWGAKEYRLEFLPKLKIEVAVKAEMAAAVLDAITSKAKTGQIVENPSMLCTTCKILNNLKRGIDGIYLDAITVANYTTRSREYQYIGIDCGQLARQTRSSKRRIQLKGSSYVLQGRGYVGTENESSISCCTRKRFGYRGLIGDIDRDGISSTEPSKIRYRNQCRG